MGELSQRDPKQAEDFQMNAETHRVLVRNGEQLLGDCLLLLIQHRLVILLLEQHRLVILLLEQHKLVILLQITAWPCFNW